MSSHGLLGRPSRILSPLVGHPIVYGKFVMERDTKTENMLRIFISRFHSFQIHYFSKRLIFNKEKINP